MKIDINRVAASALEAALREEPENQHRGHGVRTLAAGAALVTAARLGQKQWPRLIESGQLERGLDKLGEILNVRDFRDTVYERLADRGYFDGRGRDG